MKLFNAIIIIIFVFLGLAALAVIATFSGKGSENIGDVEIWGPLPGSIVEGHINNVSSERNDFDGVRYTAVNPATFIEDLVEAIAANRGPDLVVFPAEYLYLHQDKLITIPFSSISRREFQNTYVEAGEILIGADGVKGLPYIIDPLVLYWNRTLFSAASIARPPRYWDEVSDAAPSLTQSNQAGSLTQSAVALGEWDNVKNAKEIILSLLRQLGNRVVTKTEDGSALVTISEDAGGAVSSAESVLRYYTEFSDPVKQVYSWNRSQPSSYDAFIAGNLAMYIGYASELQSIRQANPNLNFDIAPLPIARGGEARVAAKMYVLAIPRGVKNSDGAFFATFILSGPESQGNLQGITGLPSVKRSLLVTAPGDPYASIFRDASLNAFVFFDLNPLQTNAIFERAVENITSGKRRIADSVSAAKGELQVLVRVR